jgi:hypothetical protein
MMEAGELLGMSERQFRRYRGRYEEDGLRRRQGVACQRPSLTAACARRHSAATGRDEETALRSNQETDPERLYHRPGYSLISREPRPGRPPLPIRPCQPNPKRTYDVLPKPDNLISYRQWRSRWRQGGKFNRTRCQDATIHTAFRHGLWTTDTCFGHLSRRVSPARNGPDADHCQSAARLSTTMSWKSWIPRTPTVSKSKYSDQCRLM